MATEVVWATVWRSDDNRGGVFGEEERIGEGIIDLLRGSGSNYILYILLNWDLTFDRDILYNLYVNISKFHNANKLFKIINLKNKKLHILKIFLLLYMWK